MTKNFYIAIIIMFGFFLSPTSSYACGTKTEKKDCCCKKHAKENDNSCGGKCGHSNCTNTTTVSLNFISFNEIEFKNNNFDFSTENKNFNNPKTYISSGFSSLWLIPKIS